MNTVYCLRAGTGPLRMKKEDTINEYLEFYMGKNTLERQEFIIGNLRVEEDIIEEELVKK